MIRTHSLVLVNKNLDNEASKWKSSNDSFELHQHMEIESLRAQLSEKGNKIYQLNEEFSELNNHLKQDNIKLQDDLNKLRDRYDRLFASHKKIQKTNHVLECNLLTSVERIELEKKELSDNIVNLTSQLYDAKLLVCDLNKSAERYRSDCNLAVQLLQCRPNEHFIPQPFSALPTDIQNRVKCYIMQKQLTQSTENRKSKSFHDIRPCQKSINFQSPDHQNSVYKPVRIPMITFPPTAIYYSIDKNPENISFNPEEDTENVPISVMAQILAKPQSLFNDSNYNYNFSNELGQVFVCSKCLQEKTLVDAWSQTGDNYLDIYSSNNNLISSSSYSSIIPMISKLETHTSSSKFAYNENMQFKNDDTHKEAFRIKNNDETSLVNGDEINNCKTYKNNMEGNNIFAAPGIHKNFCHSFDV